MSVNIQYRDLKAKQDQKSVSADTTLTYSDSGKTILLDATGEQITLPTVKAGIKYKFLCQVTTAVSNWTIINGNDVVYGSVDVNSTRVDCSAKDIITLVVAKFLPGDWISLESDGTNWYIDGSVFTAAGVTFTT